RPDTLARPVLNVHGVRRGRAASLETRFAFAARAALALTLQRRPLSVIAVQRPRQEESIERPIEHNDVVTGSSEDGAKGRPDGLLVRQIDDVERPGRIEHFTGTD